MNSRIKRFMEHKGLTSSELADTIGVQRSNVTHVLHGRNKPSFPFISKLLETYPEINAKWLIMGEGQMLESGISSGATLFQEEEPATYSAPIEKIEKKTSEKVKHQDTIEDKPIPKELVKAVVEADTREIERVVIFYTDQTFKQYTPSK